MNKKVILVAALVGVGLYVYSQSQKSDTTTTGNVPYAQYEGYFVNAPDGSVLVVGGKLYPVTQGVVAAFGGSFQHINITEAFWSVYGNNPLYMGTDSKYLI